MLTFVVGVLAGGVAGFYCRDEINGYFSRQMLPLHEQLADSLRTTEEATSAALVRVRTAISAKLRNAEQSLQAAKQTPAGNVGIVSGSDPS